VNSSTVGDDGGSPFPEMVTRAWVKELKHRRRLFEAP
jgi:serine/threonine-protein kinase HipA